MDEINELFKERLKKLDAFRGLRLYDEPVDPYGGRFERSGSLKEITSQFEEGKRAKVAGRLLAIRTHGKSSFCDLRDQEGKLQLYLKEDVVGKEAFEFFTKIDIGDVLGAEGTLFKTKTGEITLRLERFELLAKNLRPLPEKWHGLKDIEIRYRQRYVDLMMNEEARAVFILRSRLIQKMRAFLDQRGFLEVETPMLHPIPGGAAGEPFQTHHNALDADLYLRLAPELYLKKLLVGGFEKVYEIAKSFRNEGISTRHNPEFTMLEAYAAYWNYEDMMAFLEEMFLFLAKEILGKTTLAYQTTEGSVLSVDLTPPWDRVSFASLLKEKYDIGPTDSTEVWASKLKKGEGKGIGRNVQGKISRSQIVKLTEELLEPRSKGKPLFVIDYFKELCPLAKNKKENPNLCERFELFIGGMEVANAYSELNDPIEQKRRFEAQQDGVADASKIDEDFLRALEYGMPPAAGLGVGIDRLTMLFTNQSSIREVILFPQLKPER
ncbi:MAG: lysine--tRNA ligase [Candidatus Omnitrophica bacterium]|nr:lysine--tRNA ligase [Candidatus Omnitrophota bacterium]